MAITSAKKEERKLRRSTVGALLKAARINSGITQLEIAKKLGYSSPQFVSNWERGESLPPMDHFPKLANLLGISSKELIDCIHHYQESYLSLEKRRVVEVFRGFRERSRKR